MEQRGRIAGVSEDFSKSAPRGAQHTHILSETKFETFRQSKAANSFAICRHFRGVNYRFHSLAGNLINHYALAGENAIQLQELGGKIPLRILFTRMMKIILLDQVAHLPPRY